MVILSIDLGKECGLAIHTSQGIEHTEEYKFKDFAQFHKWVKHYLEIWNPDMVIVPNPTRYYDVIFKHGKMMGIIQYLCQLRDCIYLQVIDAHCKQVVIGKGNAKKAMIAEHYPQYESEHVRDAVMFIDAYMKEVEEKAKKLLSPDELKFYIKKRGWNDSAKKLFQLIDKEQRKIK